MDIFMTGATGYIGGAVALKLMAGGHRVSGLTRSAEGAAKVRALGIEPVMGTLNDARVLTEASRAADAVINAANSDEPYCVEVMLDALAGTGKTFIQTSGSSVVSDRAAGEPSDHVFHEDSVFDPLPERAMRIAIDRKIIAAAQRGVRTIVLRPTLIYGRGPGVHQDSIQVPRMIAVAKKFGAPRHVGRGLNMWSNVHIDDVVSLFVAAFERALPGSLFYAENGENAFREVAEAIGRVQGNAPPQAWPIEEAVAELGAGAFTSFGSNSRVRAAKARGMLGWSPQGPTLIDEIERGCYREQILGP